MKPLILIVACLVATTNLCAKPIPQSKDDAKPTTLVSPSKELVVLSNRAESIVSYFGRQKIMVAGMLPKELNAMLEGKSAGKRQSVNYSSYNTEPMIGRFGSNVVIETPSEPIVRMIREATGKQADRSFALIFRVDEKNPDQVAIVGYTYRSSVSFFNSDRRVPPDDFSPADLVYKGEKAK